MPFSDWFSGFVNLDLECLHDGRIIQIKSDGEIDFETLRPLAVTGSYDDTVIVKSCPVIPGPEWSVCKPSEALWRVYISGNPTKYFQGHNVYGHPDMIGVIYDFIRSVLQKINIDEFTIARVLRDPVKVTRLDITQNYLLNSPRDVTDWLRAASQYMTGKNQKISAEKTIYVGKNSRRVSIKMYEKSSEMLKHRKNFNLSDSAFDILHSISSRLLRIEITLRGMKLEDIGYHYLSRINNQMLDDQYNLQLAKINLPDNFEVLEDQINNLPPQYVAAYTYWQNGLDLKTKYPKRTYYRYRKFFLESFSIDIAMPPRDIPKETNVIPLWRYISAGDRVFEPGQDDEYLYVPLHKS